MPRQKPHTAKISENICPDIRYIEELLAQTEKLEHQKVELERRVYQLRLENDILEKTAGIIKKARASV